MSNPNAVTIEDVTRMFAGNTDPAVDRVSLAMPSGEIIALVGESGSGKTTFLRLIAGLETPDSGSITLGKTCVVDNRTWTPPEQRKIGFVFQDGALFPHLTSYENVAYGLKPLSKETQREVANRMFSLVGMDGFQDRYPHQLSGGERQRLALARAMAPGPSLILLDEPFSNLDPSLRRNLREEIRLILKKGNATAIMVTHDTDDALAIGDRVAVLRKGQIEQIGSPSEIYHQPANPYCARLFGPINNIATKGGQFVRQSMMELHTEEIEGSYPVEIESIHDAGKYFLATVQSEHGNWTIKVSQPSQYKPGQKAWVSIDRKQSI